MVIPQSDIRLLADTDAYDVLFKILYFSRVSRAPGLQNLGTPPNPYINAGDLRIRASPNPAYDD